MNGQALVSLTEGGALCATLPDGQTLVHDDVTALAEALYRRGFRADTVQSLDWHVDLDHAPSSSEKIALKVTLRRLARDNRETNG